MVQFIHASDIHLGHHQFNIDERFQDFGRAFCQVVQYAIDHSVDFMIIGGDYFHKRAINAETLRQAMEMLQPLRDAGIPVIAIEGNHDKAFYQDRSSWLKLLNSLGYLMLLKPVFQEGRLVLSEWSPDQDGCITQVKGIRIIGLGYLGATTEQRLLETAEQLDGSEGFTILVLHAAVNKFLVQDLGGVKKEVLENFRDKVDYIALGHIHSREEDGWIFNPGALENCHIDEAKEGRQKGFYHVRVTGRDKTVAYVASNPRAVRLAGVDISGAGDQEEVFRKVISALDRLNISLLDRPMLQVVLKGATDFSSTALDPATMAREIRERYGCLYVEVQNNVNLSENGAMDESGARSMSRGHIERQVLGKLLDRRYPQFREYSDELVNLIIKVKEAALAGENPEEIAAGVAALAGQMPDNPVVLPETQSAAGGMEIEDKENQASEY